MTIDQGHLLFCVFLVSMLSCCLNLAILLCLMKILIMIKQTKDEKLIKDREQMLIGMI